jgi:hypothetical protein
MSLENRTYPLRRGDRLTMFILTPLLGLGWIAIFVVAPRWESFDVGEIAWALALNIPMLGFLVTGFLYGLRTRVTFTGDEIIVQHAFRRRHASLAAVSGFRRVNAVPDAAINLFAKDASDALLKLPADLETDPAFDSLLESLENLDQRDTQRSLERFLETRSQPGSDAEKLAGLKRANAIATAMLWATLALFVARVFVDSQPILWIALAILPWVAVTLAAVLPELYVLEKFRNEVRASLLGVVWIAGMGVAYSGLGRYGVLDAGRLAVIVSAIALASAATSLWLVPSLRTTRWGLGGTLIMAFAYGYGLASAVNRDLDPASATAHPTVVEERLPADGRDRSVRVAPWGPRIAPEEFTVAGDFYDRVSTGEKLCVELSPGVLGVRWYELAKCPAE